MSDEAADSPIGSNAYYIFILTLTVLSMAIMVALLLPLSEPTQMLLGLYDDLICVIFLIDFAVTLRAVPSKKAYFFRQRGWLDLLGSIPTFGVFKYAPLLRLARISRLIRVVRRMARQQRKQLVRDVLTHRSQYAGFVTLIMALLVLIISSVLVLEFESVSRDANITSGWDSLWFAIVTITTVGYGDYFPVTVGGRITAMFLMFAGVGIIGALASILASLLVGTTAPEDDELPQIEPPPTVEQELAAIREELANLRQLIEKEKDNNGAK